MSGLMGFTMGDSQAIGVVLAAAVAALTKLPRPLTGFSQTIPYEIVTMEIWGASDISLSSDGVNSVVITAGTHHFINVRFLARRGQANIADTYVQSAGNINVIAHCISNPYPDLVV